MNIRQHWLQIGFSNSSLLSPSQFQSTSSPNVDRPMKNYMTTKGLVAMLAAGFVLASSTPGAFARGMVVHSGNVVHTQLYDRAGKTVNRLPGRAYGVAPKKATC